MKEYTTKVNELNQKLDNIKWIIWDGITKDDCCLLNEVKKRWECYEKKGEWELESKLNNFQTSEQQVQIQQPPLNYEKNLRNKIKLCQTQLRNYK